MDNWELINAGYDTGDETVVFGTRAFAQSDGFIYETSTFATIHAKSEVTDPILIAGSLPFGGLCLSVDNSLTVFEDVNCSVVNFNTAFDSVIDTWCCSPCGRFVFVGLNNSFIHCLHLPSHGQLVFSKNLKCHSSGKTFAKIIVERENDLSDTFVVCSSGMVIRLENIDLHSIHLACSSLNYDQVKDLAQELVTHVLVADSCTIAPVQAVTSLRKGNCLCLLAVGKGIATFNCGSLSCEWTVNHLGKRELVKVEALLDGMLCFALTNKGELMAVCPDTLTARSISTCQIRLSDFHFVNTLSEPQFLGIILPNEIGQSHLILLSVYGFQEKFSLPIKMPSKLVLTSVEVEDLWFVECISVEGSSGIDIVAVKAAVQVNPQFRLERMLSRLRFDDAEALAKNFGLDATVIHKSKAQYYIEKLQPWKLNHTPEESQSLLNSLTTELNEISDLDFVCSCCVNAIPPSHDIARFLLEYAQSRLEHFSMDNPELECKVVQWSQNICSTLLRLETMALVKPTWNVEDWLDFCKTDVMKEVRYYLGQGDLLEASILWSRHEFDIRKNLEKSEVLNSLLEIIPVCKEIDKILQWLTHMLPTVMEIQPASLSSIASWSERKICDLERSHPRSWPLIGLESTEKMIELFSSQEMTGPFLGVECSPLRPLIELRSDLSDIYILSSKYHVYISLQDFRQSPEEVAVLILDIVCVSTIPILLRGFLDEFVLSRKLLRDEVLSGYILGVLECSVGWWYWDEAPWESKISALIPQISSYKLRLECIIASLVVAPIPWSSTIVDLCQEGLCLKHPLTSQIREKQKQVAFNLILKKYNLKGNIMKTNKRQLIHYIIKEDRPEAVKDIYQLSKDVQEKGQFLIMLLLHHLSLRNVGRAIEILKSLSENICVEICPRLIQLSVLHALHDVSAVEDALEFLTVLALRHKAAAASCPPGVAAIEDLDNPVLLPLSISQFKNMLYLKRDFGRSLSNAEMSSSVSRLLILEDVMKNFYCKVVLGESEEEKVQRLYQSVLYLARLLSVPQAVALTKMAELILTSDDVSLAADILRRLGDAHGLPDSHYLRLSSLAGALLEKCRALLTNPEFALILKKVALVASHLSASASVHCHQDDLIKILIAHGWVECWLIASGQDNVVGQRDALQQWRFTPMFRDLGIAGFSTKRHLVQFVLSAHDVVFDLEGNLNSIIELPAKVRTLQNDQHDVATLLILSRLLADFAKDSNRISDAYVNIHSLLVQVSEVLLIKVISARQLDVYLGLSLVLNLGQESAIKWFSDGAGSSQFDLHKQRQLASLGTIVFRMWNIGSHFKKFQELSLQNTWGSRLLKHNFSCKELFHDMGKDITLQKLISSKSANVQLIRDFCTDYGLDAQVSFIKHLSSVLLSWDPEPVVTINNDGSKEMVERHTQQELFAQCWEIQKAIDDKSALRMLLINVWKQVSFYHHEVFLVILDILEKNGIASDASDLNSKRILTTFLKGYRRVKPPVVAEVEFWAEVFTDYASLPAIAVFRMPYCRRLIETPLNIIRRELNLETYQNWLPVASTLDITRDQICTNAVHETVTDTYPGVSQLQWCDTIRNEALFTAVAECVAQMDDIVQAAATLFFYTNKIPPGADQVSAAGLCMQYAEEVVRQTSDTEWKVKVEKKYLSLATTQTLHAFGLGTPSYLLLVHNPEELICQLYLHPNILDICRGTAHNGLDINGAVRDISEYHGLSLKTLHMGLIMNWLQPEPGFNGNNSFEEDTMCGMSLAQRQGCLRKNDRSDLFSESDDDILRARYVMEFGDVQEWALFLISLIFVERRGCVGLRLRALQCLCMLTDDETLEELSGRSVTAIREYLRSLAYLRELEYLGFAYSDSGFEECDKKELALLIIRSEVRCPRAVIFLINLCRDYKINHLSIWDPILAQMVDLAMIKELEQILPRLVGIYQLWNLPSFKKAWNLILLPPFTQVHRSLLDSQQNAIMRALDLFLLCPVLKAIGVASSIEDCISNHRPDIGALLLPFIESQREVLKKKILSVASLSQLEKDINSFPLKLFWKLKVLSTLQEVE